MANKTILFVHQNFPGQFPHIARALLARGDRVVAIGGPTARDLPGVALHRWTNSRSTTRGLFAPATRAEADLIRADAATSVAVALRDQGIVPDVIVGHPAWGETLHLRAVFPDARLILFGELFYRATGADVGFDPEYEAVTLANAMRTNAKNAMMLLAYSMADRIVCPTPFQANTFPAILSPLICVFHEGLDLDRARRRPAATFTLDDGRVLDASVPVVTFINRNFERLRGFHIFMRALPAVLAARPDAHVVLIGGTAAGYGGPAPGDADWKAHMLAELGDRIDLTRLHFVGRVPHDRMIDALSISAAHVYYTYPFILSWSLIEAMACECLVLGSDTPPVRDAIDDGTNGILNDFFDVAALSAALIRAIETPSAFADVRAAARRTAIDRFDQAQTGVPAWLTLIDEVAAEPSTEPTGQPTPS